MNPVVVAVEDEERFVAEDGAMLNPSDVVADDETGADFEESDEK